MFMMPSLKESVASAQPEVNVDMSDQRGLVLNGSNSTYNYRYRSTFGDTDVSTGFGMTYNGVPVVYVPKEWAEKGAFVNDTQYLSPKYLNAEVWQYMKPAQLEPGKWNETLAPKLSGFVSNPYDGYIIDETKYKQFGLSSGQQQPRWTSLGKPNPPISGIGENNGQLVYVGKSGDNKNGELAIFDSSGQGNLYVNTYQSSFWGDVGRTFNKLGPATLLFNAVVPGLGTAIYAGTNIGQAITSGNWGRAALNIALTSLPGPDGISAAQGTIFEIPAVTNSVKTISSTLGISAAAAGTIVNGAVNLLANGGNLVNALKTTLAQELGQGAAQYASQLANLQGMKGLDKVLKSVTKDSTQALILNQDVTKAAKNAFVNSAVPLALESTPGWNNLSSTQQRAVTSAAISAASGGKIDIGTAIKSYTAQVFADAALGQIGGSLTESQKQLARQTIIAGIEGKPLDSALQSFMINEAKNAISNQVAQAEGWENNAQKQSAIKQYGDKVKPDEYIAKQQGWEDLAEKQAAIKAYGETITPVGVKEREQVKSIDPAFDAEAYSKLNNVSGDPFQHFLQQGQKSSLPTTYEKGAEAALKSIGYDANSDEIKQVSDLFKKSADPDVALAKFYDEHWVTPEEAAATAKQAGFELTPDQISRFTGQARVGQNTVFEDITTAAGIGKESTRQRQQSVENYLSAIKTEYRNQGYSDAEIAAAESDWRKKINSTMDKQVEQIAEYAAQTKLAYGENSKEYADAKSALAEAKASLGGYGIVKEGDTFKDVFGRAGESLLSAIVPSAQAAGSDRLVLPNPKDTEEIPTSSDYKYYFDILKNPNPESAYASASDDLKKAIQRAQKDFSSRSEEQKLELLNEYRRSSLASDITPSEEWIDSGKLLNFISGDQATPSLPNQYIIDEEVQRIINEAQRQGKDQESLDSVLSAIGSGISSGPKTGGGAGDGTGTGAGAGPSGTGSEGVAGVGAGSWAGAEPPSGVGTGGAGVIAGGGANASAGTGTGIGTSGGAGTGTGAGSGAGTGIAKPPATQGAGSLTDLLALLGMAQAQQKKPEPFPLVGEIKPYEFSGNLLEGVYQPYKMDWMNMNDQLLNLARGNK